MLLRQSVTQRVPVRLVDATGTPVTGMLSGNILSGNILVVKSDGTTASVAVTNSGAGQNWYEIDSVNAPGLYHFSMPSTANGVIGGIQWCVFPAAGAFVGAVFVATVEDTAADVEGLRTDYTTARAAKIDNLDAAISTRSTYAGADTSGTTTLLGRIPGTVQPQTGDSYARLGAPAGASHAADIAAVKSDTGTLTTRIPGTVQPQTGDAYARIGAPAGASISADIAAAKLEIDDLQNFVTGNWKIFTTGPDANRLVLYMSDGVSVYRKYDLKDAGGAATTTNPFSRTKV